jgi:hypothetical protein
MNIIEVFGLSRSGHHAVINWIIKNLCGLESEMKWKLDLLNGSGVIYINEANLDTEVTFKYIEEHLKEIKYLVLSYENTSIDYTILNRKNIYHSPTCVDLPLFEKVNKVHRVIVLRDFYNNLASRIEANNREKVKFRDGTIFQWDIDENYINLWKEHAKGYLYLENRHIKFEDWLYKDELRKKFLSKNFGIDEKYDNNVEGTHSSFGDNNYLNRVDRVEIPDNIKKIISNDSELHYLMGKLNYQYKKL